jgi:hypothetical protein
MNVDSEQSRSLWTAAKIPAFPKLTANLKVDVLVIGGGIAGLSTAYELASAGHDVAVIDRGPIGKGMTARTSAHLSYEIDDTYAELIDTHGEAQAKKYFASQKAAVDRIEEICRSERIACDFARLDLFVFAPDNKGRKDLDREIEAAARMGFEGVAWADAPIAGESKGCLRFPNQARFHPVQYLAGLAKAIKRKGGQLYSETPIVSVEETARGPVAKTQDGVSIRAKAIVAATNAPITNRLAVHTKQAPYRTFVLTLELPQQEKFDSLLWDTEDPYHYVRAYRDDNQSLIIVGGEDHKTGSANDGEDRLKRLETWARKHFPKLGKVRHRWSGQIYEPADYLPFVGRSPGHKKVFLVTGDSGEGLTTGVAASLILPGLIEGRKSAWAQPYRPNRKIAEPSPAVTYVKDMAGAAAHLVAHVLQGEMAPADVPPGEGAIVTINGKKTAAYRDAKGKLHCQSAACTHVGCVIQWNNFEKCWDCPCHGSQFGPKGEPLQAPATSRLTPLPAK